MLGGLNQVFLRLKVLFCLFIGATTVGFSTLTLSAFATDEKCRENLERLVTRGLQSHFVTSLSVSGALDDSADSKVNISAASEAIMIQIKKWLASKEKGISSFLNSQAFTDGGEWKQDKRAGASVIKTRLSLLPCSNIELDRGHCPVHWAMEYIHPGSNPRRIWFVRFGLSIDTINNKIALQFGTYYNTAAPRFRNDYIEAVTPNTPRIITDIIRRLKAFKVSFSDGTPVRTDAIALKVGEGKDFIKLLLNQDRFYPIIYVSKHYLSGSYYLDPDFLAKTLRGAALVFYQVDQDTDEELSFLLPPELRTSAGSVRIYYPGIKQRDGLPIIEDAAREGFRHRCFVREDLQLNSVKSLESIFQNVMRSSIAALDRAREKGYAVDISDVEKIQLEHRRLQLIAEKKRKNEQHALAGLETSSNTVPAASSTADFGQAVTASTQSEKLSSVAPDGGVSDKVSNEVVNYIVSEATNEVTDDAENKTAGKIFKTPPDSEVTNQISILSLKLKELENIQAKLTEDNVELQELYAVIDQERTTLVKEVDDLRLELRLFGDENEALREQIRKLEQSLELAHQNLQEAYKEASTRSSSGRVTDFGTTTNDTLDLLKEKLTRLPTDLLGLVELAQILYSDKIVFTDRARRSAKGTQIGNQKLDKVWAGLVGLANVVYKRMIVEQGKNSVQSVMEEFQATSGLEISFSESAATRQVENLMSTRDDVYDGRTIRCEAHFRWKGNDPTNRPRLYFGIDRESGKIVVSFLGSHLPTSSTKRVH